MPALIPLPIVIALIAFVIVSCALDVGTRRIPNFLTGTAMLAGLALNTLYWGWFGLGVSLTGLAAVVAILLAPFAFGGIGGGDVKMMAAVGALLGPRLALAGLVLGMVVGGATMLGYLGMRGRLGETLASIGAMVAAAIATRSVAPLRVSASESGAITLPYSVPLAVGTVAVLALSEFMRLA